MNDAVKRGPNYNWEIEANHFRIECEKLRELLSKVELQGERDAHQNGILKAALQKLHDGPGNKTSGWKLTWAHEFSGKALADVDSSCASQESRPSTSSEGK